MSKKYDILEVKDKSKKHIIKKDIIPDIPYRMIVSARSGLGKSNLLINLLLRDKYYLNDFDGDDIYIISGSLEGDDKLKKLIRNKEIPNENLLPDYIPEELNIIYDFLVDEYNEAMENKEKVKPKLIILDDVGYKNLMKNNNKNSPIDKIFCNGRKYNISVMLLVQRISQINTVCRSNANSIILFEPNIRETQILEQDYNYLGSKKEFYKMVNNVFQQDKHSFLFINLDNNGKNKYFDKNFNQIIVN